MENIKQQGLSSKKIPLEYSPVVFNESLQDDTKDFQYGGTIQKLRPWIEVLKSKTSSSVWHFQITATWSIAITGLWFTPTYIEIISTVSGSTWILESRGLQSWANTYTHYNYNTTSGLKSYYVTNNIVVIEDGSSGSFVNTYASFTSFDSDWFTINVGTRNQTVECTYIAR